MKKTKLLSTLLLSTLLGGVAKAKVARVVAGSGTEATEIRTVGHFDGVRTCTGIDAIVSQSPDFDVRVVADAAVMPYLKTEVVDGVLIIRYEPSIKLSLKKIKSRVYVSAPEIRSLNASSSGDIRIEGALTGEKLAVKASSSGDVKGRAEYGRIEATASSSGDIRLSGTADDCILRASSSGDIDFGDLVCRNADADASSSGDVTVHATEKLNVHASSSGSVLWKGDPAIKANTSSGGTVKRKK